jgi:20S proteasome alpha/beta subunit
MASDSRISSGISSNDSVDKILQLDSQTAVGIAGDGNLGIHLFNLIKPQLRFKEGIFKVVEQIRELLKKQFEEYYSGRVPEDKALNLLVVGYDPASSTPHVYQLLSEDGFIPRPSSVGFNCIGIPFIADYILNRFYEKEITTEQAQLLSTFCIEETVSQSHAVGGDIKVATFSPSKTFSILSPKAISDIRRQCQGFHQGNKAKFYPEQ